MSERDSEPPDLPRQPQNPQGASERRPPDSAQNIPPVSADAQDRIAERQDKTRTAVAACVVGAFVLTAIMTVAAVVIGGEFYERAANFFPYIFTAVGTSIGSAVGFYFGSQR